MGSTDAQPGREAPAPSARPSAFAAARQPAPQMSPAEGPHIAGARFDFAVEYERAYRVLWTVAAGVLGGPTGAEDLVQEAACLALAKQDQFAPGTNFAAWMAQMVRFVGLNQLRKDSRTRTARLDQTDVAGHLPRRPGLGISGEPGLALSRLGEMPPDQRSFDDDLMHALSGLTDVARACLLLRTLEGLDYAAIGQILELPEGTAMSHVHRSRLRLREQLLSGGRVNGTRVNGTGKGQQP